MNLTINKIKEELEVYVYSITDDYQIDSSDDTFIFKDNIVEMSFKNIKFLKSQEEYFLLKFERVKKLLNRLDIYFVINNIKFYKVLPCVGGNLYDAGYKLDLNIDSIKYDKKYLGCGLDEILNLNIKYIKNSTYDYVICNIVLCGYLNKEIFNY